MQSFDPFEMWNNMGFLARLVVVFLGIMSIYSIWVMIDRFIIFSRAKRYSVVFITALKDVLQKKDLNGALKLSKSEPQTPVARVVEAALTEYRDALDAIQKTGPDEIGDFDVVEEDLDERIICGTLVFRVKVSVGIPDEDLEDLRVDVQPKLTQSAQVAIFDDVPFDPLNFVAKGFGCAVGPGFFRSFGPSTDLVTVGGVAVASPSASVTLAADSDIWRDADATGALYFTVVAHDETPPAAATGRLRIGRTVTDSTGVVRDDFVCSRSVDMGALFTVP